MTRTVTALFDSHLAAEQARKRLANIGISSGMISITELSGSTQARSPAEAQTVWEKVKQLVLPPQDRIEYEEGIRRGGSLLSAAVDDAEADRAIEALEECHPIDMDQRRGEWLKAGWSGERSPASAARASGSAREEVIPVAEEQLRVGKREARRGGIRVRSYITEQPVQENVRLREEHVDVERRPASQAASTRGDPLKERTVEMRETAEEPVVQKEMQVKEEVVVRKRAEEREQPVKDTVRRTQVDVEKNPQNAPQRGADPSRPAHRQ